MCPFQIRSRAWVRVSHPKAYASKSGRLRQRGSHPEIGARQGWLLFGSQILPFIVGDNARAMALAAAMQARGFDIRGIRPPTVPAGTARLRISLTNNVGESDVRAMLEALAEETGERR